MLSPHPISHAISHDSLQPRVHNLGIATFSDFIETSSNRIACEFSGEWACSCARVLQIFRVKAVSPLLARACVGLKPSLPLRAGEVGQLKPSSPLRLRNGCLWCVFRLQRCCRFHCAPRRHLPGIEDVMARDTVGGFATLGAGWRRVAGVSDL